MALPSRPLGGDQNREAALPPLNASEDFELPDLDFGEALPEPLPELPVELPSSLELPSQNELPTPEDVALPDTDLSLDDFFAEAAAPQGRASVAQFTEDFEELPSVAPVAKPAVEPAPAIEDELPDMDFDALFDEPIEPAPALPEDDWDNFDEPTPPPAPPELPEVAAAPEEEDWGDFDSLFDEPAEPEPPVAEIALEEPEDFDGMFDEEPAPVEQAGTEELTDWSEDFDKFIEDDEEPATDELEEDPEYVSTFDQEEEQQKPLKKNPKGKKSAPKGKGGFGKFSNGLVNKLGSIPVIGKLFRPLAAFAGLFTVVLMLLPLAAIPFIIYNIASSSVPGASGADGPDGAAATFSNFSYSNGEVTAELTNTGEVVANVIPTVSIWNYNPFGGGSLFGFDKVNTCEGEEAVADIDETVTVTLTCENTGSGISTKASGEVSF